MSAICTTTSTPDLLVSLLKAHFSHLSSSECILVLTSPFTLQVILHDFSSPVNDDSSLVYFTTIGYGIGNQSLTPLNSYAIA